MDFSNLPPTDRSKESLSPLLTVLCCQANPGTWRARNAKKDWSHRDAGSVHSSRVRRGGFVASGCVKAPAEVLRRLSACLRGSEKGRTSKLVGLRREPHAILEGLINIWIIHFALPPAGEAAG